MGQKYNKKISKLKMYQNLKMTMKKTIIITGSTRE